VVNSFDDKEMNCPTSVISNAGKRSVAGLVKVNRLPSRNGSLASRTAASRTAHIAPTFSLAIELRSMGGGVHCRCCRLQR